MSDEDHRINRDRNAPDDDQPDEETEAEAHERFMDSPLGHVLRENQERVRDARRGRRY